MLRVLRRYGYLVHLLYALLSGRTVVVLADPSHQRYSRHYEQGFGDDVVKPHAYHFQGPFQT